MFQDNGGIMFNDQSMFYSNGVDLRNSNQSYAFQELMNQNLMNQNFNQSQGFTQQTTYPQAPALQNYDFAQGSVINGGGFESFNNFDNFNHHSGHYMNLPTTEMDQSLDPALFSEPSNPIAQQNGLGGMNTTDFFLDISSVPQQHITQNNYHPALTQSSSNSSLGFTAQSNQAPIIHAHKDSLNPSSAAYPQFGISQSNEWKGPTFQSHRRSPSDARSDISSAHPSPYLVHAESFESFGQHSPMLNGQNDATLFNDPISTFNQFSLTETHNDARTPADSPLISPVAPSFFAEGLRFSGLGTNFGGDLGFQQQENEAFPTMQINANPDAGYTEGTLSPPEIVINVAPPTRTPTMNQPSFDLLEDTLSPPLRSELFTKIDKRFATNYRPATRKSRANSAPYPPPNPEVLPRGRSPSVGTSLTPHPLSRSPSPALSAGEPQFKRRSSNPDREGLLRLAGVQDPLTQAPAATEPSISPTPSADGGKRAQKHPANFACTLCDKRFTRAYNLRSHLRTHTDERPFVCTVCGKAFARQHDRKRHEGLHTGERKFVCHGLLKEKAGTWGCKRRFARADALGRHFRSEAGRACIRPLLDEEALERHTALIEQANQNMLHGASNGSKSTGAPMGEVLDVSKMPLPAALLALYPALADIQWNAQPMHQTGMDGEADYDGFDASSGAEDWDDDGEYLSGNGMGNGGGWASDYGAQG